MKLRLPIDQAQHIMRDIKQASLDIPLPSEHQVQSGPLTVKSLLQFEGQAFIDQVYHILLSRSPGLESPRLLLALEKGCSKKKFITHTRYSTEGSKINRPIKGLVPRSLFALQSFWLYPLAVRLGLMSPLLPSPLPVTSQPEDNLETQVSRFSHYQFYLEQWVGTNPIKCMDLNPQQGIKVEWSTTSKADAAPLSSQQRCEQFLSKGHTVTYPDRLTFLQQQPDQSYDFIACFNIATQILPDIFFPLVKEAYRTLAPGGLVLFVAPNTNNQPLFDYMDPLGPSYFSRFSLESNGFTDVNLDQVHPSNLPFDLNSQGSDHTLQNYFLIGRKS